MYYVNLNSQRQKMKLLLKYFVVLFSFFLFFSCEEEDKSKAEIDNIKIDLDVVRYDRLFANVSKKSLPELKKNYPYMFAEQYTDSFWINKLTDTLQLELEEEVDKQFGDFKQETEDIESLFKHFKYYFPGFKVPKLITVISEVQYNNRIIVADSLVLVGLDNYLGKEHRFYEGLPNYISKGLDKTYLASNIGSALAKKVNKYPRDRTFLSRMVYYGKELYLLDKLVPRAKDYQKINYTEDELAWAFDNEEQIWRYFVEQQLLYSTDSELDNRFLNPAPFSKFQLELDIESPGRLGRFMGWQIVRAFMDNNPDLTPTQLLKTPPDVIFKKSNYKPKK